MKQLFVIVFVMTLLSCGSGDDRVLYSKHDINQARWLEKTRWMCYHQDSITPMCLQVFKDYKFGVISKDSALRFYEEIIFKKISIPFDNTTPYNKNTESYKDQ